MVKDKDLKLIAQALKATKLFTVYTDVDRLINKQELFLVAAGLHPVCNVVSAHLEKTPTGRGTRVPDDQEEVAAFLDELGLVYTTHRERYILNVHAAKMQRDLKKIATASTYERCLLFGWPQTAVAALSSQRESFSRKEQDELLKRQIKDERLIWFINLSVHFLSKKHYQAEIKELKRRFQVLEKFGLAG